MYENLDKILSKENYDKHMKILDTEKRIKELQCELEGLKNDCDHFFMPLTPKQKKYIQEQTLESFAYDETHCLICNEYFGPRCLKSPDESCHAFSYNDEDGYYVKLNNGSKFYLKNYTLEHALEEHDDRCIFCGISTDR